MGVAVGFIALLFASVAMLVAIPLGWLLSGYRRAVFLLALLLALAGLGLAWIEPIVPARQETAVWPIATGGAGALMIIFLGYWWFFGWLWRLLRRAAGRSPSP